MQEVVPTSLADGSRRPSGRKGKRQMRLEKIDDTGCSQEVRVQCTLVNGGALSSLACEAYASKEVELALEI